VGVTVRSKISVTKAPALSVDVTAMLVVPTSPFVGVPEKMPVSGSKLNQLGTDAGLYVKLSLSSTSVK
jgi:hypothetical protein